MRRSTNRILTTHVGSLPRPADVLKMNTAKAQSQPYDPKAWAERVRTSVADVVRRQVESGVDIVNDGEISKLSWSSYVNERLTGFETRRLTPGHGPIARGRDKKAFPEFYDEYDRTQPFRTVSGAAGTDVACIGAVAYKEPTAVRMDIENLKAALAGVTVEEAFITAVAPGSVVRRSNQYYPTEQAFLYAVADAMGTEYKAIVDAGFILQIDDPQLVTRYDREDPVPTAEQYRKLVAPRIEALNHALAGIPQDRVRYHICWGGWHGPHTTDFPLKDIVSVLLKVRAGGYLIEAANARHEHEWHVWEGVKLPDGKVLIPGMVSHATNVVEHPELVAERILRFANVVGRENLIAGTDCGLGGRIHHELVWAKLRALTQGAELATKKLWPRARRKQRRHAGAKAKKKTPAKRASSSKPRSAGAREVLWPPSPRPCRS